MSPNDKRAEIEKEIAELEAMDGASIWGLVNEDDRARLYALRHQLRRLDAAQNPALRYGDPVIVVSGGFNGRFGNYLGEGMTLAGERRVIVEHPHHILRIYAPGQIERVKS